MTGKCDWGHIYNGILDRLSCCQPFCRCCQELPWERSRDCSVPLTLAVRHRRSQPHTTLPGTALAWCRGCLAIAVQRLPIYRPLTRLPHRRTGRKGRPHSVSFSHDSGPPGLLMQHIQIQARLLTRPAPPAAD